MRHLKNIALLTALTLGGAASAAVDSTSSSYGSAYTDITTTGTYQKAVSFSVPNSTLTIPSTQVRPGADFTVTVPVTNTTDHTITITARRGCQRAC